MTPRTAKWLLGLIALDVMLLPVVPWVFLPASMFVAAVVLASHFHGQAYRLGVHGKVFLGLLASSLIGSLLFKPKTVLVDNGVVAQIIAVQQEDLKRFAHLVGAVLLFVVARGLAETAGREATQNVLRWVAGAALLSMGLMYAVFQLSYETFETVRGIYFGTDVSLSGLAQLDSAGYLDRFSHLLLDPNNAGYFMLMLAVFALAQRGQPIWLRVYALSVMLAVPFVTRSLGALLAAGVCVTIALVMSGLRMIRPRTVLLLCTCATILVGVVLFDSLFEWALVQDLVASQQAVLERWESNTSQSRFDIWLDLVSARFPPLIGDGYVLIVDDHWFSPHSDHLRITYSFGLLAYGCLLVEAARGHYLRGRYLYLVPVAVALTINSAIDEPRFLFSAVLLIAASKAQFHDVAGGSRALLEAGSRHRVRSTARPVHE